MIMLVLSMSVVPVVGIVVPVVGVVMPMMVVMMPVSMLVMIVMSMTISMTMMAMSISTLRSIAVTPGAFRTARLVGFPAGSGNIIAPLDVINLLQIENVCETLLTQIRADFGSRDRITAISPGVNSNSLVLATS